MRIKLLSVLFLLLFFTFSSSSVFAALQCEGGTSCRNAALVECRFEIFTGWYCASRGTTSSCGACRFYGAGTCGALLMTDQYCSGTPGSCSVNGGDNNVYTSGCYTCDDSYTCSPRCGQTVTDGCGGSHTCSTADVGSGCSTPCTCGSNNWCCGESCGTDVCGNSCGSESDSNHWDGCGGCSSPYCGQSRGNSVCGHDCGDCDDYRSDSLTVAGSVVHDLPLSVSGTARDDNGSTNGVEDIHVYTDGDFWTSFSANGISINTSNGSFSGSIGTTAMQALYDRDGRDGSNQSHSLQFYAVQTEGGTCGNWSIGTRTVSITNSAPTNSSFSPNSGDIILDHGGPVVDFTATFSDSNPQTVITDRDHDARYARVRIGESGDPLATLYYEDVVGGTNTLVFDDYGNNISISNENVSAVDGGNLTVTFRLDFSSMAASLGDDYNIYMYTQDWAAAEDTWQNMGTLGIWNGADVYVSGTVYDVTATYPYAACSDFPTSGIDAISVDFDDGSSVTSDVSSGGGNYAVDLTYGTTYTYSLDGGDDHTGVLAELSEVQTGRSCEGGTGSFTLTASGANPPDLDFGMSENLDSWIQVLGGSVTSFSTVSDLIPLTCVNSYDGGGACLPFVAIDSPVDNLDENGVVAAQTSISLGDASSSGDPDDWQVIDSSLWQQTGRGFSYYSNLMASVLDTGDDIYTGDTNISSIVGLDDGMVASGEEEIKLVNGNLTIDQDLVVANGGLAVLLVSGNITVDGAADVVEGIFIADGSIGINGDSSSNQAQLAGAFVADSDANGSGTVGNSRDRGFSNNLEPATTFTYRPDMIVNLIKSQNGRRMSQVSFEWEEINP